MELGKQLLSIIDTLNQKNQMEFSHERDGGSDYEALKFTTNIDGLNYTVAKYHEILPNWKDSGSKGDYLNIVTVTDSENNTVAKMSASYSGSHILDSKNTTSINLESLKSITDNLEVLPPKDIQKEKSNILANIKSIRNNATKVETKNTTSFDWK